MFCYTISKKRNHENLLIPWRAQHSNRIDELRATCCVHAECTWVVARKVCQWRQNSETERQAFYQHASFADCQDVNSHNILIDGAPEHADEAYLAQNASFWLIDFGLAVDSQSWVPLQNESCPPEPKSPDNWSSWLKITNVLVLMDSICILFVFFLNFLLWTFLLNKRKSLIRDFRSVVFIYQ